MRPTDMRIERVDFSTQDFAYRSPIKFGGTAVDKATLLTASIVARLPDGKTATGWGSMPLGNVWSFPSKKLDYGQTLEALRLCGALAAKTWRTQNEWGHPMELGHRIDRELSLIASRATEALELAEPIPVLAAMVANSPFDAAVHDAYGKLHEASTWKCYGPGHLPLDLSTFLGDEFDGETLVTHVRTTPVATLPLYHLVGALDPLGKTDVQNPMGDGVPETLEDWIPFNGLTHLKIKLSGEDIGWDVERVLGVEKVAARAQANRGQKHWHYSLDFNEKCPSAESLLEFLNKLKEKSPEAFNRIAYIEQPTKRDLRGDRANRMHRASALVPVVIDESLVDLDSLRLAREMGYTGAALKACKGQTQSLLMAAAARKWGMFLCVQDLTCPGMSLVQSAGLAAHIPGMSALEANARQYMPAANSAWEKHHPGLFVIRDGLIRTKSLIGPGLNTEPPEDPA